MRHAAILLCLSLAACSHRSISRRLTPLTPPPGYTAQINAMADPAPPVICNPVNQPFSNTPHYGSSICQNVPAAPQLKQAATFTDPAYGGKSRVLTPLGQTWVHGYSLPTPISANNHYVGVTDPNGNHFALDLWKPGYPVTGIPGPTAAPMWDAITDDVFYWNYTWSGNMKIQAHSLRFNSDATVVDLAGKVSQINTGGSTHLSSDNWMAFWSEPEHQVCAVELITGKTFCADYQAADPNNRVGWNFIDYSMITNVDVGSGKRYVLLMAAPAFGMWSVNMQTGKLDFVMRGPEQGVIGVNDPNGNRDGVCDPNENCMSAPHADITQYGGVQYLLSTADLSFGGCERQLALYPLAQGIDMGKKRIVVAPLAYCSSAYEWPDMHFGCSLRTGACVISTYTNSPAPYGNTLFVLRDPQHLTRLTLHYSQLRGSDSYWYFARAGIGIDGYYVVYDSNFGRPDAGNGTSGEQVVLVPTK